jgi:hypothetical protein
MQERNSGADDVAVESSSKIVKLGFGGGEGNVSCIRQRDALA